MHYFFFDQQSIMHYGLTEFVPYKTHGTRLQTFRWRNVDPCNIAQIITTSFFIEDYNQLFFFIKDYNHFFFYQRL